jgi:hypothetical protein
VWGIAGLVISAAIFGVAALGASNFPALIQNGIIVAIIFVFLLGLSVAEIPMMLYGLRLMACNQTKPVIIAGTFVIFVAFASVYASIFVVLTANLVLASALAFLSVVRFVGGLFWIR